MESINISENLSLTIFLGVLTILSGMVIIYITQRRLFNIPGKKRFILFVIGGGILTLIFWPIVIFHKPLEGFGTNEMIHIWNYYGFPFPIHKSHAYFPELTMSITRHPFFSGLFANFLIYSLFIMIFYKIIYAIYKKIRTHNTTVGASAKLD